MNIDFTPITISRVEENGDNQLDMGQGGDLNGCTPYFMNFLIFVCIPELNALVCVNVLCYKLPFNIVLVISIDEHSLLKTFF